MGDQSSDSATEESWQEYNDSISTVAVVPSVDPSLVPKLGMVFDSEEKAFQFYVAYGHLAGFGVTRRSNNTYEGFRYRSTFICSKGGKTLVKEHYIRVRRKREVKTNCKAKMIVKDHHFSNRWEIVVLDLEHNHPLDPTLKFRKMKNSLSQSKLPTSSNILDAPMTSCSGAVIAGPDGCTSSSSIQLDRTSAKVNKRKLMLGAGDLKAITCFLDEMTDQNPLFFYSLDMDDKGHLSNVFWADARSRVTYNFFSDVMVFNLMNFSDQYEVGFATFSGVNHHGQVILFGCGFICDRTAETFEWIFNTWLKCMQGMLPGALVTNYCHDIEVAVRKVFPDAQHRFCLGDILSKIPTNLEGVKEASAIISMFDNLVYDSVSSSDFEKDWDQMIQQFMLDGNKWCSSLYDVRKKWAPVYVKDTFWAGASISDRNDCISNYFEGLLYPETTVKQFLEQYTDAVRSRLTEETYEDSRSFQMRSGLVSGFPLDEQIVKMYTLKIFQLFQNEVEHVFQMKVDFIDRCDSVGRYNVTELINGKQLDFRVAFDSVEHDVWCICRLFQYKGILCRHALSVLRQELVILVPNKYILTRWRKDFKQLRASSSSNFLTPKLDLGNYDDLYRHVHHYFVQIVEFGATDETSKHHCLSVLKEIREKVNVHEKSLRDQRTDGDVATTNYSYNLINEDFTDDLPPTALGSKVWDPMQVHSRGRTCKKKHVLANPSGLRGLKKGKRRASSKNKSDTSPTELDINSMSEDPHLMQHDQLGVWSLTPRGASETFPYGVETIAFDLPQYNNAPAFQWPESSRSRLL